jgi:hypothetical protein
MELTILVATSVVVRNLFFSCHSVEREFFLAPTVSNSFSELSMNYDCSLSLGVVIVMDPCPALGACNSRSLELRIAISLEMASLLVVAETEVSQLFFVDTLKCET